VRRTISTKNCSGFSLVELAATLLVASAVLAGAVPMFANAYSSYKLKIGAEAIATHLYKARSRAISQNQSIRVIFSKSNGTYGIDLNNNETLDSDEATTLPSSVSFTNDAAIIYTSRGELPIGSSPPSISVGNPSGKRTVRITSRGSVSLH